MILDATLYNNKPDSATWGAKRIKVAYAHELFKGQPNRIEEPYEENLQQLADNNNGDLICLDIEHWDIDSSRIEDSEYEINADKLGSVADRLHSINPGLRLGYYSLLPIRSYWAVFDLTQKRKWETANARHKYGRNALGRFEAEGLADKIDVTFPSLYTFYTNQQGWLKYAKANIKQARRYQKQVYPFIWPDYHGSNSTLGNSYIGDEYFKMQLETCLEYADGVVIWGGWKKDWSAAESTWLKLLS